MRSTRIAAAAASQAITLQLAAAPRVVSSGKSSRENPASARTSGKAKGKKSVREPTKLDDMPLVVLEKIVSYLRHCPNAVARLALLNNKMYFLVGGVKFWKEMANKMNLPPPNPRARKYRTWFAVVGKRGKKLCHWCYNITSRSDLLMFGRKTGFAKLCPNCRAKKWRHEKEHRETGTGAKQGKINKRDAKGRYHRSDQDMAQFARRKLPDRRYAERIERQRERAEEKAIDASIPPPVLSDELEEIDENEESEEEMNKDY
ncbi:hypothetical protein HDU93_006003 [Gonapodya sp. JEL0774]|nr:hypothetical protein HDU93_006003 [Gonapodya sp. JEL0774]